jgi:hypothetical protein
VHVHVLFVCQVKFEFVHKQLAPDCCKVEFITHAVQDPDVFKYEFAVVHMHVLLVYHVCYELVQIQEVPIGASVDDELHYMQVPYVLT